MVTKMTSIILTCYNQTRFQAHMSMACIANITRYTDPDQYELIVMDADSKYPIRDDYKVLKIDKLVPTKNGYTASMNEGVKLATGDYLVFMQNDVFVWEDWLTDLRWYLENGKADCVIPDQVPRDREFVKSSYSMEMDEAMKFGSRDAGLLMIKKEAFNRTGGWNEKLSLLAERDFYQRMGNNNVKQVDTCKVMITHIMAATNLYRLETDSEDYEEKMRKDAETLNDTR